MAKSPPKPAFSKNDLVVTTLPFGTPMYRLHNEKYAANSFNPGIGNGRFHPITDIEGESVPTLYGANQIEGAFSEVLLRDRKKGDLVFSSELIDMRISVIAATRPIKMVDLTGIHISALGVKRKQLLEVGEKRYKRTRKYAKRIHKLCPGADGMQWISRQCDTAVSYLLFGDRIDERQLVVSDDHKDLTSHEGLGLVMQFTEQAGVVVVR